MRISQKALMARFSIFCCNLWGNFTKNGTNLSTGQFFFVFDPFRQLCFDYRQVMILLTPHFLVTIAERRTPTCLRRCRERRHPTRRSLVFPSFSFCICFYIVFCISHLVRGQRWHYHPAWTQVWFSQECCQCRVLQVFFISENITSS